MRNSQVIPLNLEGEKEVEPVELLSHDGTGWFLKRRKRHSGSVLGDTATHVTAPASFIGSPTRSTSRSPGFGGTHSDSVHLHRDGPRPLAFSRRHCFRPKFVGHEAAALEAMFNQHITDIPRNRVVMVMRLLFYTGLILLSLTTCIALNFSITLRIGIAVTLSVWPLAAVSLQLGLAQRQRRNPAAFHASSAPRLQYKAETIEWIGIMVCCAIWLYTVYMHRNETYLPFVFLSTGYITSLKLSLVLVFPYQRSINYLIALPLDVAYWGAVSYPFICEWWHLSQGVPCDGGLQPYTDCMCKGPNFSQSYSDVCIAGTLCIGFFGSLIALVATYASRYSQRKHFYQVKLLERFAGEQQQVLHREEVAIATRKQFMAYVFHELRVPFQTVSLGFDELRSILRTSTIVEGPEQEAFTQTVHEMDRAAESVKKVLDNVLDLGNLEEGTFALDKTPTPLNKLVQQMATRCAAIGRNRHVEVATFVDNNSEVFVDGRRITEAVVTLVSESFKMGSTGIKILFSEETKDWNSCLSFIKAKQSDWLRELQASATSSARPETNGVASLSPNGTFLIEHDAQRARASDPSFSEQKGIVLHLYIAVQSPRDIFQLLRNLSKEKSETGHITIDPKSTGPETLDVYIAAAVIEEHGGRVLPRTSPNNQYLSVYVPLLQKSQDMVMKRFKTSHMAVNLAHDWASSPRGRGWSEGPPAAFSNKSRASSFGYPHVIDMPSLEPATRKYSFQQRPSQGPLPSTLPSTALKPADTTHRDNAPSSSAEEGKGGLSVVDVHSPTLEEEEVQRKGGEPVELTPARGEKHVSWTVGEKKSTEEEKTKPTALVVDDSKGNRVMVKRILLRLGFEVSTADDGLDALLLMGVPIPKAVVEAISIPPEKRHLVQRTMSDAFGSTLRKKFDYIFLDFEMPILNGAITCRILRDAGLATPVVGITGISSIADRKAFLNSGVDKLLFKPISRSHIEEVLQLLD